MAKTPVVVVNHAPQRDDAGLDLATEVARDHDDGETFIIVRRAHSDYWPARWDAVEWRACRLACTFDHVDDHACLLRVGFGLTRRHALRVLRTQPRRAIGASIA